MVGFDEQAAFEAVADGVEDVGDAFGDFFAGGVAVGHLVGGADEDDVGLVDVETLVEPFDVIDA